MRKPKKNLPASGGDGGGKRCVACGGASLSWDLCRRCNRLKRSDITMLLPRRVFLTYCSGCFCYLQPPNIHVRADPNSSLLLDHCVRRFWKPLKCLPICFVDAKFVESSDPDVIRVDLHLRGEISQGTVADRHHLIEFPVRQEICKFCSGSSISDLQRRRVTRVELHQDPNRARRNFLVPLSRHRGIGRIDRAIRIQEHDMGTDILFPDRTHAVDCVRFFEGLFPVKKQSDDDGVSATFFSLHVLPIRPYELIRLPAAVSGSSPGGVGNLFICTKVSAHGISLMDPFTPRSAFLTAEDYWRAPFDVALDFRRLVEYLVLDIVMITPDDPPPSKDAGDDSCCLAHAHIVLVSDLGKGDGHRKLMVRTHLGLLFKPGDYALGYDVGGAGGPAMEVILVRKAWHVNKKRKTTSSREPGDGISNDEYEELLRELEENTQLGDEASADNATMEWLPSTQLSSLQQESIPSVKDEPSSASKSAPLKGAASEDSKTGLVPSAVPVTEEEVKSVLLATAPVRLLDLLANFKGRIKSQADKNAIAAVLRTSKLQKTNGKYYVVLKDNIKESIPSVKDEPSSASKSAPLKGAASADSKTGLVPSAVPATEEEVKSVLLATAAVRLLDLLDNFKGRIKSQADKKAFAAVLRTSKLQKTNGKYYVVLKDNIKESIPSVKGEPSSASKSAPLKGAASADSKTGLVPSAVPFTEEEVKSVLLAMAPVRLLDLLANFKGRIKSQAESIPSVKDEPSSASKSAPLKGAASEDSKTGLVPSAVPVTEEEVKSVLLATAPVRLLDLLANFKGRIKSQADKNAFAAVLRTSKIQKTNGNYYICSAER